MRGFSLIEIAVVIVLIAVMAALLTPIATNYIDQTRMAAAQAEARAIGEALQRMKKDLGRFPFFSSGSGGVLADSSANIVTLRGPGRLPTEGPPTAWTSGAPSDSDCASGCQPYFLNNVLSTNLPGYPTTSALAKPFKWNGPYMDVHADPWGSAYLVNIINAKSASSDACFVLSAGPNARIETSFNNSASVAFSAGGDDIVFRVK